MKKLGLKKLNSYLEIGQTKQLSFLVGFILIASTTAHAWTFENGPVAAWLSKAQPSQKMVEPMSQYFTERSKPEIESYIQSVFNMHKSKVAAALKTNAFALGTDCVAKINVQIGPVTPTNQRDTSDFESQLIQIEQSDCLPQVALQKVFDLFISDDFMLKANASLKDSRSNTADNSICQMTSVFGLGNSDYCVRVLLWKNDDTIVISTFNEYSNPQVSAPVYLRFVSTAFKKQKDGTVAMYTLTHGRGPKLPFHIIVKSTVKNENIKFMNTFIAELRR